MKLQSIHARVSEDREKLFELLSRADRFPEWAKTFCLSSHGSGNVNRRVRTVFGPVHLFVQGDAGSGVIDYFFGEERDEMNLLPLRLISIAGGTLVSLTLIQPPGVSNETYERAHLALTEDLRQLVRRFGGELQCDGSAKPAFFPGLVTEKFYETWDFYTTTLGFRTVAESDACVLLEHSSGARLNVHRHEVDGLPPTLSSATDGRGFWLQLRVSDAREEHERLREAGADFVDDLHQEHGCTEFSVRDPNGVVIRIAHETARPLPEPVEELLGA